MSKMKTAIIHDWLVSMGGGEKVLQSILELYPSPIYTLVQDRKFFGAEAVKTSFLQKIPASARIFRNFLPLFPMAIEQFDLREYDLILSNSHAVAKGVLTGPGQLHLCYCHTPMRYAWDLYQTYMKDVKGVKGKFAKWILHYLRNWDIGSLNRVDHFIANSRFVARRIKKLYGKEATVIYPPVATDRFGLQPKEDFYLTVSRLVPYKRIDLIVEALVDKKLVVIGDGSEWKKIKNRAGKNVEFLGHQSDEVVRDYLERAKGFIIAAEEDFGIAPVEALAARTPVIAFGKGGALETVTEETGVFFAEQTTQSLREAIERFEKREFDPQLLRDQAEKFSEDRFKREFKAFVEQKWKEFCESHYLSRR